VRAVQCAGNGIVVSRGAVVRGCVAARNVLSDFVVQSGGVLVDCAARENTKIGFVLAGEGCLVSLCAAEGNYSDGFALATGCIAKACTATGNDLCGFTGAPGASIIDCLAVSNTFHGVTVESDCTIRGNTCAGNGNGGDEHGIVVYGSNNRIEGNSCTDNDRGIQVLGGGNLITRNSCSGNAPNWDGLHPIGSWSPAAPPIDGPHSHSLSRGSPIAPIHATIARNPPLFARGTHAIARRSPTLHTYHPLQPGAPMASTVRLHRVVRAPADRLYRAFLDPKAMVKWLPPHGFVGEVHRIDARVGGSYRMSFTNFNTGQTHAFGGTYAELKPGQLIRYTDKFEDPNMPDPMNVSITLRPVTGGTDLTIIQEGIPAAIPVEMCHMGWQESLAQLAMLVEPAIP